MKPKSQRFGGPAEKRKGLIVWGIGLATLILTIAGISTASSVFVHLSNIVFDSYQRLKPRQEAGAPVVVVDIDEASLKKIGQWPWPRTTVAKLVDRLGAFRSSAIAFDMVFPEADRTSPSSLIAALRKEGARIALPFGKEEQNNDAVLARAFAKNRVVAGIAISNETANPLPPPKTGFAFGGESPKSYLPRFSGGVSNLPVLTKAASGIGFISFPVSSDGVVRSLPLVAVADGHLYPALSIEALRIAQGAGAIIIRSTGARGEMDTGQPAMTALNIGAFSMPTGAGGQFRIYYSNLPKLKTIPAAEILDSDKPDVLAKEIAGHIVLIGTSAVGLRDLVTTPIGEAVPGVRVNAEIIDQIVGQDFLSRPDWARNSEITLAIVLGLILLSVEWRFGALLSTIAVLSLCTIVVALSWVAFSHWHLLLDPILPATTIGLVFMATMPALLLLANRERRFVRSAFSRYLSPALVGRLADNPAELRLGGEVRDLTILFSDIRGFTTLSEHLDPNDLTRLLNDYLTPTTDILLTADATIDKYIGDAIMAFWNAPLDIPDHRRKACLAALGMCKALGTLNQKLDFELKVGIGLNSGDCCVGNLGSTQRFSYSAIGDNVNLASRIEGLTKQYGVNILVTENTQKGAPELAFMEADLVRVVGREQPIKVFTLVGDSDYAKGDFFLSWRALHERFLDAYRRVEMDVACRALDDVKAVAPMAMSSFYDVFTDRLVTMREDPPGPEWDGIYVSERK